MAAFRIRRLGSDDSLEALTELLHRAYGALAAMGFRYLATHQDVATTQRRIAKGECHLALLDERVIGTILVIPPGHRTVPGDYGDPSKVAVLSQFAVEPEFQRQGVGGKLLELGERRALELGAEEASVDTAEGAVHLIELYKKRGYREVGYAQWNHTNYRSVLLSKRLERWTLPTAHLIHGYLGAGKTTFARQLQERTGGIRYSPDERMVELYGFDPPADRFAEYLDAIYAEVNASWPPVLSSGVDVILDFGFWTRAWRDRARASAQRVGAHTKLYWLRCSEATARERCRQRNLNPQGSLYIADDTFEVLKRRFEPLALDEPFDLVETD